MERGTSLSRAKIIFFIQASKLVEQGCLAYLTHVRDNEIEATSIGSIPMLSDTLRFTSHKEVKAVASSKEPN